MSRKATTARAYYNEHDPFAAAWLRELIKAGHIAPGDVDERSIEDVCPDDLAGYVQCHFFAGIGVWSHALRMAGWPDHRAIWTGSCPCQPFSAAGKGAGFDDERHLWPAFFDLIQQCNPPVVIGEQVASKDGLAWLDLVSADVEGSGRAFAAADLCAAGFGAPHIRQRSYWVAHANRQRRAGVNPLLRTQDEGRLGKKAVLEIAGGGAAIRLADNDSQRHDGGTADRPEKGTDAGLGRNLCHGRLGNADSDQPGAGHGDAGEVCCLPASQCQPEDGAAVPGGGGSTRGMAHLPSKRRRSGRPRGDATDCDGPLRVGASEPGRCNAAGVGHNGAPSAYTFWSDADWLGCRDGKWRPVEPGTFPLAHGAANRVGRLRGYGNAIVGPVAQGFIEAVMAAETRDES